MLIALAKLVFDLNFTGNALDIFIVFIISALSVFSIGFLIASIAPNMKAANGIANFVYFPMLFLTGATIPIELMPASIQKVAQFLPVTHAVEAMKQVWLGGSISSVQTNILILVIIMIVCFVLSFKLFKWE